jgi:CheY-like chemotaxis protein
MDSNTPRPRLEARQNNERPHVLAVTDDPDLADFLSQGLPLGGFWTSIIANGLQALEVFRLRQFDLVLIDAEMQGFDAMEFLRRLRGLSELDRSSAPRTAAPAVLVHSGSGKPNAQAGSDLGIAASVYPPLDLDELVRILHDVFQTWRRDHPDSPLADSAANRAF